MFSSPVRLGCLRPGAWYREADFGRMGHVEPCFQLTRALNQHKGKDYLKESRKQSQYFLIWGPQTKLLSAPKQALCI